MPREEKGKGRKCEEESSSAPEPDPELQQEPEPELRRIPSPETQSQPHIPPIPDDVVVRPRADSFLIVCRVFSVITALSAILCTVVNILSAIRLFESVESSSDVFDGIFRCYAAVLAAFVVVAETEWSLVFKLCKVLEYCPGRAMLQIFVAIMTRAFPDYSGDNESLVLLHDIACYLLLACGAVYLISGILCIGYLKRARERRQMTKNQAAKDLEELDKRRQELESLLIDKR